MRILLVSFAIVLSGCAAAPPRVVDYVGFELGRYQTVKARAQDVDRYSCRSGHLVAEWLSLSQVEVSCR